MSFGIIDKIYKDQLLNAQAWIEELSYLTHLNNIYSVLLDIDSHISFH